MKRLFLICVIVGLSFFVAISGNYTLINSKSVLKKQTVEEIPASSYRIFVDITENRLYLIKNDTIIKSFPVSLGQQDSPSPIGNWQIVKKEKLRNNIIGYWLGFNVPWGNYGIHGTADPCFAIKNVKHGCIRMFNDDVAEVFGLVDEGTVVEVYAGPNGSFTNGYRELKYGDRGSDVYEIEGVLKDRGYFNSTVNGIYDKGLLEAVKKFEKDNGLKESEELGYEFYEKLGIIIME